MHTADAGMPVEERLEGRDCRRDAYMHAVEAAGCLLEEHARKPWAEVLDSLDMPIQWTTVYVLVVPTPNRQTVRSAQDSAGWSVSHWLNHLCVATHEAPWRCAILLDLSSSEAASMRI